jgi:photosystem II stability/assembly factor-like uncharacterized protein
VQHHNGVFRSADGGKSWQSIPSKPSSFGFAAAIHPRDPKTSWLVPLVKDERRVPVDGKVVVARTRDAGESFDVLREGLPQEHAYDVVYRHGMDVDKSGDRIAMGSTTGSLWLSEDQGDSFRTLSSQLPPSTACGSLEIETRRRAVLSSKLRWGTTRRRSSGAAADARAPASGIADQA